ncbi:hypothetical protein [Sinobacterium caligoides]|nr:hypothetical protein [Sinobacterium caligoides]
MAFESCPECNAQKHQLVKCPQCGFQRNPHNGPIVVDVQPQRENHGRPQRDSRADQGGLGGGGSYQPRQRRSQHGLRQHDQRRSEGNATQAHPNSYDYKPKSSGRPSGNSFSEHGNSASGNRYNSGRTRNEYNMQPRHNQFGQPVGGAAPGGSDVLQEPRKQAKAAVITYKRRPRVVPTAESEA